MVSQELEFRGINSDHLRMYLEELGAKGIDDKYIGEDWSGEILREGEISFTSAFKVNTVHICFTAENNELLNDILKRFRLKTTRIGG